MCDKVEYNELQPSNKPVYSDRKALTNQHVFLENMTNLWKCLKEDTKTTGILVETRASGETTVDVITLPNNIHWLTEYSSHLFVRQCDKDLYEIVMSQCNTCRGRGVVVLGNTGMGRSKHVIYILTRTGTSWFLSYCLYRLAMDENTRNKPVFFESVSMKCGFFFEVEGGVTVWPLHSYPKLHANTVYLFDPDVDGRQPVYVPAFTIIATSSPNHYSSFVERQMYGPSTFFMPVWSRAEIQCVEEAKYMGCSLSHNTISARFDLFGGIPRYLFQDSELLIPPQLESQLNAAVKRLNMEWLPLLSNEIVESESDMLVQLHPVLPGYNGAITWWTSEQVGIKVFEHLQKKYKTAMSVFLDSLSELSHNEVYLGDLFERLTHKRLVDGGTYSRWCDGKLDTLVLPPLNKAAFDDFKLIKPIEDGTYYQPSKDFPVIDSMALVNHEVLLFQITLNHEHKFDMNTLNNHLKHMRTILPEVPVKYVFVVSAFMFEKNFPQGKPASVQSPMFTETIQSLTAMNVSILAWKTAP